MRSRIVDPREQIVRASMEGEGFVSQRGLTQRDEEQRAKLDSAITPDALIVTETLEFWIDNAAANTTTTMHSDTRSSDALIAMTTVSWDMPAQGRLLVCRIVGSADVTAGTIVPQLRVSDDGVTDLFPLESCELSTAVPRLKAARFPWATAIQISANATIRAQLVADASFAPAGSVDYHVKFVIGYDPFE